MSCITLSGDRLAAQGAYQTLGLYVLHELVPKDFLNNVKTYIS